MQWTPDHNHAPLEGEHGIQVFISKEFGGEQYVGVVSSDKFCLIATEHAEQAASRIEEATLDESGFADAIRTTADEIRSEDEVV